MEEQPGLLKNKMDLATELNEMGVKAKQASAVLNTASSSQKDSFFDMAIKGIKSDKELILMANHQDVSQAKDNGKDDAFIDRLELNPERIEGICKTLEEIKLFPDPVGKILATWDRPNGLNISRVSTPLGVIGIIFESRPNVASDAGGL